MERLNYKIFSIFLLKKKLKKKIILFFNYKNLVLIIVERIIYLTII